MAHGHLLQFKQIWRADGYSLGDLLYSLPLAPCQKKEIAVIDWERQEIRFAGLSWAGHCNGWAAAALLEPEPTAFGGPMSWRPTVDWGYCQRPYSPPYLLFLIPYLHCSVLILPWVPIFYGTFSLRLRCDRQLAARALRLDCDRRGGSRSLAFARL